MSQTIKTEVMVDGSAVGPELNKVAALHEAYKAKIEKSQAAALSMHQQQLTALRMEAMGLTATSTALREKINLQEQARQLAARAGISEQTALQMVQERAALEKKINVERARSAVAGKRLPELQLTPEMLTSMQKHEMLARSMGKAAQQSGKMAKNGSMGFLAFTQAVEDAQYGVNGVLNNIPQMIMGWGGSMRMAGMASLTAVAGLSAYKLGFRLGADPKELDWADRATKGQLAYRAEIERGNEEIRKRQNEQKILNEIEQQRAAGIGTIKQMLSVDKYRADELERQASALQRARDAEDALAEAKKNAGLGPQGAGASEAAKFDRERSRNLDDIAAAQARVNELEQEYEKIWSNKSDLSGKYEMQKSALMKEVDDLEVRLNNRKAEEAKLTAMLDNPSAANDIDIKRMTESRDALVKEIGERNTVLEQKRAEIALSEELAKRAVDESTTAVQSIKDKVAAKSDEISKLKDELKIRDQMRAVEMQAEAERSQNEWMDARIESEKRLGEQMRKTEEYLKQQKELMQTRANFAADMMALQLESKGQKEKADALRKEMDLRSNAVTLAKELQITEAQALELLRRKASLQERIQAGQGGRGGQRGYRGGFKVSQYENMGFGGGLLELNRGGFLRDGMPSLKHSALNARGAARAMMPKGESTAGYWARQLDLQEKLVAHLTKIGAV